MQPTHTSDITTENKYTERYILNILKNIYRHRHHSILKLAVGLLALYEKNDLKKWI